MRIVQSMLAYAASTFAVQATSHFVVFREHYSAVSFLRTEPVFALGVASMLLQGGLLGFLFEKYFAGDGGLSRGLKFGLTMGAFFASYSILAEPAKYTVPSIASWMGVEALASFAQFGGFGLALGWIYRDAPQRAMAGQDSA